MERRNSRSTWTWIEKSKDFSVVMKDRFLLIVSNSSDATNSRSTRRNWLVARTKHFSEQFIRTDETRSCRTSSWKTWTSWKCCSFIISWYSNRSIEILSRSKRQCQVKRKKDSAYLSNWFCSDSYRHLNVISKMSHMAHHFVLLLKRFPRWWAPYVWFGSFLDITIEMNVWFHWWNELLINYVIELLVRLMFEHYSGRWVSRFSRQKKEHFRLFS